MMLHIGDNHVVAQRDIVIILPTGKEARHKSDILLANGTVLKSPIASITLKRRMEGFGLPEERPQDAP